MAAHVGTNPGPFYSEFDALPPGHCAPLQRNLKTKQHSYVHFNNVCALYELQSEKAGLLCFRPGLTQETARNMKFRIYPCSKMKGNYQLCIYCAVAPLHQEDMSMHLYTPLNPTYI